MVGSGTVQNRGRLVDLSLEIRLRPIVIRRKNNKSHRGFVPCADRVSKTRVLVDILSGLESVTTRFRFNQFGTDDRSRDNSYDRVYYHRTVSRYDQ